MNTSRSSRCATPLSRLWRLPISLFLALAALAAVSAQAQSSGTGTVTGSITSAGTHNALQGATVNIPSLNLIEFTDQAGHFTIKGVPSGVVDVIVNYSGFEEARQKVSVSGGSVSQADMALKSAEVLTMQAFTVESEKEGAALSLTQQRNAVNPKTVVAFDEWGLLPTQNVGELATRLPGVTVGNYDEDNLIQNISIRGQPASYTRLNIDGMATTGVMGDGRSVSLHAFSGSMYEQIEIIAGQTPDKRADSLGGQFNLKTRSPLAQSERRRINYSIAMRDIPSFSKRNSDVAQHAIKPDASFSYTEVFDIAGGHRNLGVVISTAYQELANPFDWTALVYENTTSPTAYARDYSRNSGYDDRFISAFSARVDYRVSASTVVSARFLYNAGSEPFFHYTFVDPFVSTNLSVYDPVTNKTGSIAPGYTATRTEILPTATNNTAFSYSEMLLNPQRFSFTSKNPTGTVTVEHDWGRLKVDHAYRLSSGHFDSNAGRQLEDGSITMRTATPIGFILDTSNRGGRVFTQTSGPSVYDVASYKPFLVAAANTTTQPVPTTSMQFNSRNSVNDTTDWSATANASYNFGSSVPMMLKGGLDTINRRINGRQPYNQRWYGVIGAVMPTDGLMPITEFENQHGGQRLPVLDPAWIRATVLNNPAYWYQDLNFTAVQQYTSRRLMKEGVDAAYLEGQVKFGRLTLLGGVREEWVKTNSFTYFPKNTRTLISVEPDPFKRAALDFVRQSINGKYDKLFPSIHASFDITSNLKARASWSTSYGRPTITQIVAAVTPNDTARTLSVGNPGLKPQMAKNIDFKLEYYMKEGGLFTVSAYQKKITDYIGSAVRSGTLVPEGNGNGFDGQYAGYELIQANNLGDATLRGAEVDFRQRLSFLPGALKGLTVRANYTYLETFGKFAGTTELQNGQVAGFIPRSYNFGLSYNYKKFGASYDINYTGRFPVGYSLTSPGSGNVYRNSMMVQNAGLTYRLRPQVQLFLNVSNLGEVGPVQYTYIENRVSLDKIVPRAIKVGLTGQF